MLALAGCGRVDFAHSRADCSTAAQSEPCISMLLGSVVWQDAVTACAQLVPPMHLATISSTDDNAAAAALAATIPFDPAQTNTNQRQRMWLGGDSLAAVGVWVWITGEPFDYTNWRAGEPGTPDTERCLVLLGSQDGVWDNRPCTTAYDAYLCERD